MAKTTLTFEFNDVAEAMTAIRAVAGVKSKVVGYCEENAMPPLKCHNPTVEDATPVVLPEVAQPEPPPEATAEQCRQAVLDYLNRHGQNATKTHGRAFGVGSVAQLKPEQYEAFLEHFKS